jgi:hypothetical protein
MLAEHALSEAKAEDILWTPRIDLLFDLFSAHPSLRASGELMRRMNTLGKWIEREEDPAALEALSGFGSGAVRYVQLVSARTIPEHLVSHWIHDSATAMYALGNRALMRRHAPAIVRHALSLSPKHVAELREAFLALEPAPLREVMAQRSDEIALYAFERGHIEALATLLPVLSGVSPELLRRLIREPASAARVLLAHMEADGSIIALQNARQLRQRLERLEHGDALDERDRGLWAGSWPARDPGLVAAALLHPNCPAEERAALLRGDFGFSSLLSHPSADAEVLQAAWDREGAGVAKEVFSHPNVSGPLAAEVVLACGSVWLGKVGLNDDKARHQSAVFHVEEAMAAAADPPADSVAPADRAREGSAGAARAGGRRARREDSSTGDEGAREDSSAGGERGEDFYDVGRLPRALAHPEVRLALLSTPLGRSLSGLLLAAAAQDALSGRTESPLFRRAAIEAGRLAWGRDAAFTANLLGFLSRRGLVLKDDAFLAVALADGEADNREWALRLMHRAAPEMQEEARAYADWQEQVARREEFHLRAKQRQEASLARAKRKRAAATPARPENPAARQVDSLIPGMPRRAPKRGR